VRPIEAGGTGGGTPVFGNTGVGAGVVETAKMLIALGEGPVGGPVHGLKSIKLDGTPIQNADGTFNFQGVSVAMVAGTNSQVMIPGFNSVETPVTDGGEIKYAVPQIFTVSNASVNAVVVKVLVPALQTINATTGKASGAEVDIKIEVANNGAGYVNQTLYQGGKIIAQLQSQYVIGYRVELPAGHGPWSIKVSRLTLDSTDLTLLQNKTYLQSHTEIIDAALRYPNTALLALAFNAQQFPTIPKVTVDMLHRLIQVPANYTPAYFDDDAVRTDGSKGKWVPAVYATTGPGTSMGAWDGTFKTVWSSNPAWVYYDMATQKRFGGGRYTAASTLSKSDLYTIAQNCDVMVSDGNGELEPRFVVNTFLQSQDETFKVLTYLMSVCRAQVYYGAGQAIPVQDVDGSPSAAFTPSNVINGKFSYTGTARKARHTVALVSWNDPAQGGKLVPEYIEDPASVARYGIQTVELVDLGCSKGQARRMGRAVLLSEQSELESVTFSAGLNGIVLAPGALILIADPSRARARMGGRIVTATTTVITLDAPVTLGAGKTYTLWVILPDGSMVSKTVTTAAGTTSTLTLASDLSVAPIPQAQWILSEASTLPTRWRVVSIKNTSTDKAVSYHVFAIANNPAKYALIDSTDTIVPSIIPTRAWPAVTSLAATATNTTAAGTLANDLRATWTMDPTAIGATAQASRDQGPWLDMVVSGSGAFLGNALPGAYRVRVAAVYPDGSGPLALVTVTASGVQAPVAPQSGVDDINSVNALTNGNKIELVQNWAAELQTQTALDAQATTLSVGHTAYDASVTALSAGLIAAGAPSNWATAWPDGTTWAHTGIMTSIQGWWSAIASAREALRNAITAKVQTTANYALSAFTDAAADLQLTDAEKADLRIYLESTRLKWNQAYDAAVARGSSTTYPTPNSVANVREDIWKYSYGYFARLLYTTTGSYDSHGSIGLGAPLAGTFLFDSALAGNDHNPLVYATWINGLTGAAGAALVAAAAAPATTAQAGTIKGGGTGGYSIAPDGTLNIPAGTGTTATWGSISGSLSSQTDLVSALSGKVGTSDSRLTDARPASDVYAWAKAASKPGYSFGEIGSGPISATTGNFSGFLATSAYATIGISSSLNVNINTGAINALNNGGYSPLAINSSGVTLNSGITAANVSRVTGGALGQWGLNQLSAGYDTATATAWLQAGNGSGGGTLSLNASGGTVACGAAFTAAGTATALQLVTSNGFLSSGAANLILLPGTSGWIACNYTSGTAGVKFYDGGTTIVASISGAGAISATTVTTSGSAYIGNSATGMDANNGSGTLVVGSGSGSQGMTIYTGSANEGRLTFARSASGAGSYPGQITYSHPLDSMRFWTNGTEKVRIDSPGMLWAYAGISSTTVTASGDVTAGGGKVHLWSAGNISMTGTYQWSMGDGLGGAAKDGSFGIINDSWTATPALKISANGSTAKFSGMVDSSSSVNAGIAYTSDFGGGSVVRGSSTGAAMIEFVRPGLYGVNFGLDSDNQLKVGGVSMGAVAYRIYHEGNINSTLAAKVALIGLAGVPVCCTLAQKNAGTVTPAMIGANKYLFVVDDPTFDGVASNGTLYMSTGSSWGAAQQGKFNMGLVSAGSISSGALATNVALVNQVISSAIFTSGGAGVSAWGVPGAGTGVVTGWAIYASAQPTVCHNGWLGTDHSGWTYPNVQAEFGTGISLGGYDLSICAIGKLINGGVWSRTTPGVYYWTCPPNITKAEFSGQAGGGSGSSIAGTGGGGGGGGAIRKMVDVVPGTIYAITVPSGGASVTNSNYGNNGGNVTMAYSSGPGSGFATVTAYGGQGGQLGNGGVGGNGGSQAGGAANGGSTVPISGFLTMLSSGGAGGGNGSVSGGSCGEWPGVGVNAGGCSSYGQGGSGSSGLAADAGYGPGAGGGGSNNTKASGAGREGFAMLRY
jgi:predicted phage tail protein